MGLPISQYMTELGQDLYLTMDHNTHTVQIRKYWVSNSGLAPTRMGVAISPSEMMNLLQELEPLCAEMEEEDDVPLTPPPPTSQSPHSAPPTATVTSSSQMQPNYGFNAASNSQIDPGFGSSGTNTNPQFVTNFVPPNGQGGQKFGYTNEQTMGPYNPNSNMPAASVTPTATESIATAGSSGGVVEGRVMMDLTDPNSPDTEYESPVLSSIPPPPPPPPAYPAVATTNSMSSTPAHQTLVANRLMPDHNTAANARRANIAKMRQARRDAHSEIK